MTISGIPSARKKLHRAQTHLTELRSSINDFRKTTPYDFALESTGNARWESDISIAVRVSTAPPIPDDWALITGDILTNVRAALDHAVFPHVRTVKPDLDRRLIQFPIEDRKAQWENKKKWFKSPVTKVVGQCQPYRSGTDFALHPLRALRELVNRDKHRELVIASYAVSAFTVGEHDLYTVESSTVHNAVPMEVGAVVAEAQLKLAKNIHGDQWHQIPSEVEYGEYIDIPDTKPVALISAMQQIMDPLGTLLDELEVTGC